jgi:hypothetical protein
LRPGLPARTHIAVGAAALAEIATPALGIERRITNNPRSASID